MAASKNRCPSHAPDRQAWAGHQGKITETLHISFPSSIILPLNAEGKTTTLLVGPTCSIPLTRLNRRAPLAPTFRCAQEDTNPS